MLVAIPLIASCGGGGDEGGGGQGSGGQAKNEEGGGGGAQGGGPGGGKKKQMISSARAVAAAPNKESLDGDRARIRGAEVRGIVSERAFFVGESDAEQLLVLNVGEAVEVSEGQEILVAGKLNTARPELEERFSLTPEEASAINEAGVFLRAPRVEPQEG